jgi:hypothetical protein
MVRGWLLGGCVRQRELADRVSSHPAEGDRGLGLRVVCEGAAALGIGLEGLCTAGEEPCETGDDVAAEVDAGVGECVACKSSPTQCQK